MKFDPEEKRSEMQWVLACVGVSLVCGVVVTQLIDSDNVAETHFRSAISRGFWADMAFLIIAILVVLGAVRLAATMRPGTLVFLGLAILASAFGDPLIISRVSPNSGYSRSIFAITLTVFVGSSLLGAGLRRLTWSDSAERSAKVKR